MLTSCSRRPALLTLLGAVAAAVSIAPTASAMQRYASANGDGGLCSADFPCTITQAVANAHTDDEVILAPGDYALTDTLSDPAAITIRGIPGQPRPRLLFSGAGQNGLALWHGSLLRRVEVDQSAASRALYATPARVDQVIARASTGSQCTAEVDSGLMRDTIVVASGSNGRAVCTEASGGPGASYRNVTAIASANGGVAVQARAGMFQTVTIDLFNVIARGGPGGADLAMDQNDAGTGSGHATITATHSNFVTHWSFPTYADIVDHGGNQSLPPVFVQPAAGNYRQAANSPTIGAGVYEPLDGAYDVDGDPRQVGTTDIGADEFVIAPSAATGAADAVTDQSATLSGSVGPNGAPTTYSFEYGPTTAYGSSSPASGAGNGTSTVSAGATVSGLTPTTTYHYRVVATNAAGVVAGNDRTFTTAAAPTPASPTAPAITAMSGSTQAFAGVRLVSTKLSLVAGRFITLRLSCPAGAAGRCSGRTKLTARGSSRITIGRATFSIPAGGQAKVKVRATRAGRRLLQRVHRLRGRATNAAHTDSGASKTVVAGVTIRRP
jgi:hypothetical protein